MMLSSSSSSRTCRTTWTRTPAAAAATIVAVIIALACTTTTSTRTATTTMAFVTPSFLPSHRHSTSSTKSSSSSSKATTKLYFHSNHSPSFASPNSDSEKFRAAIAAAASAKAMYYQSELTIQELNQIRAQFELLLQNSGRTTTTTSSTSSYSDSNHQQQSFDSSTIQTRPGLEVYYPEGVIHNPTVPASTSYTVDNNNDGSYHVLQPTEDTYNDDTLWRTDIVYDEDSNLRLLTTAGRRLRELEIQLLESLRTSNDGIDQLIHLWTTERNAESAYALLQMQNSNQICSVGLVKEEADLAALCRTYPGWAEPWSRLATLLFYKGIPRWGDALSAAEEAIRIKPWHFEALNVCTLILSQMDHPDNPSVIFGDDETVADLRRRCYRLSRLSLPKIDASSSSPNGIRDLEARNIWVSRAVATAQYQLQCAEQYTAAARDRPTITTTNYHHHQQQQHYSQSYNHQHHLQQPQPHPESTQYYEQSNHIITDAWQ